MIRLDGNNLVFIISASAAALSTAYVFWGSPFKSRTRRKRGTSKLCPGLINTGNTCFLNALLQALAPCKRTLQRWLEEFNEESKTERHLTKTLLFVLKALNNELPEMELYTDGFDPACVFKALSEHQWNISTEQQDAHELLHVILSTLWEEVEMAHTVSTLFSAEWLENGHYLPAKTATNRSVEALPKLDDCLLTTDQQDYPFRGLVTRQRTCQVCQHKSKVTTEPFESLTLQFPVNFHGDFKLHQLLRIFNQPERIDGVECEGCALKAKDGSKPKAACLRTTSIGRAPACLCIHISRVNHISGVSSKRGDPVRFDEILDLGPYMFHSGASGGDVSILSQVPGPLWGGSHELGQASRAQSEDISSGKEAMAGDVPMVPMSETSLSDKERQTPTMHHKPIMHPKPTHLYRLMAVTQHQGLYNSGHFITFRRSPAGSKRAVGAGGPEWLMTSDDLVQWVSFSEVLQAEAYMLFYERIQS